MKSKIMALVLAASAVPAFAQPGSFTDLGNRTTTQTFTQDVTLLAANDIQWYRIVLPQVTAAGGWVDIWTSAPGDIVDSEIGLYDSTGVGAGSATTFFDDDSGAGNLSQLTFGSTIARPLIPGSAARNGSDGVLAGGEYYLAVGRFNVTFVNSAFNATSTYAAAERTTTLNFDISAATDPTPPTGVGAATPGSVEPGNAVVYSVTVTPGINPTSTGIAVSGDLGVVGGPANAVFHDDGLNGDAAAGDLVYSYSYVIPNATAGGNYTIPVTITDAQARTGSVNLVGNVFNPLNLGTLVDGTAINMSVDVGAFEVKWYRMVAGECSTAAARRLTISTFNTPAPNDDSELGLYNDAGGLVASNDDREIFAGPARLTFGDQGTDGNLDAGTYFLALGTFNIVFNPNFGAVADLTIAQTALTHELSILQQQIVPPVVWNEADGGDAGDLVATAQTVTGSGQIDQIVGDVTANDVDMYRINICDAANFSATTVGNGNTADTRLFLFNTDATGIVYNDDAAAVGGSTISAASGLIPGNGEYYIAVTRFNIMASDEGANNIWNTGAPFTGQFAPNGAAPGAPVAQWTGAAINQAFATYTIALTGACASDGGGPVACSEADIGIAGGLPGQDNLLDNNDFIAFINYFFALNPIADMGIAGGLPGADGQWDNNDFIAFINHFFADGANCNG